MLDIFPIEWCDPPQHVGILFEKPLVVGFLSERFFFNKKSLS